MQLFAYLVTAAHLNWSLVFGRRYRIDLLDEQLPNGAESGIANQLKSGGSKASIYSVLTELSRGEVTGYRHAFTKCAKLQDWMDLKEFGQLMELLNELGGVEETIAVHELKQMFGKMAVDDVVSFHDFLIQMYEVRLNVNLYELHRLGFDTIDCARDSDKHISAKDLVAFVNKTEAARLRAGQEFVLADALVGFNEESAEKMVREAESFFDHELVDVFDFQVGGLGYMAHTLSFVLCQTMRVHILNDFVDAVAQFRRVFQGYLRVQKGWRENLPRDAQFVEGARRKTRPEPGCWTATSRRCDGLPHCR
eukprot:SAG31_NODE_27_length_32731_cov_1443.130393_25_plen_308_part_00